MKIDRQYRYALLIVDSVANLRPLDGLLVLPEGPTVRHTIEFAYRQGNWLGNVNIVS